MTAVEMTVVNVSHRGWMFLVNFFLGRCLVGEVELAGVFGRRVGLLIDLHEEWLGGERY